MGGGKLNYVGALEDMGQRVDRLDARRQAAVFWLLGSGLLAQLDSPRELSRWLDRVRLVGHKFVTTGEVATDAHELWSRMRLPASGEESQLLNSTITCLSTPVGIAAGLCEALGSWIEYALFPLVHSESLKLFDDIAYPGDDEELQAVYDQPSLKRARGYCDLLLSQLESLAGPPDDAFLSAMLSDADQIAPSRL